MKDHQRGEYNQADIFISIMTLAEDCNLGQAAIAKIIGGAFVLFVIGVVAFVGFDFVKRYRSLALVTIAIALVYLLLKIGGTL
jgi:hypothetical protein